MNKSDTNPASATHTVRVNGAVPKMRGNQFVVGDNFFVAHHHKEMKAWGNTDVKDTGYCSFKVVLVTSDIWQHFHHPLEDHRASEL